MKIERIEVFPIILELNEPFIIGNWTGEKVPAVITRIHTDEGIIGHGEAAPAWEVTGETQEGTVEVIAMFRRRLVGMMLSTWNDVLQVVNLLNPIEAPQIIWGAPSAKASIEGAVLDAYGQYLGKPVYSLFGGTYKTLEVPQTIGICPVEKAVDRAVQAVKEGARRIKLKVGLPNAAGLTNYARDVITVKEVRAALDRIKPEVPIVADANQGYVTPQKAIEIGKQFEGLIEWLEHPVLAYDKLGLAEVRKGLDIPIMADEAVHNLHDARLLLELDAVDYINIKLMKSSGIVGARRIADLAEKHGVPCQIGSMVESTVATAMGFHTFLSHDNIRTGELGGMQLLKRNYGEGICFDHYKLLLSEQPGLGVTVRDEELEGMRASE